MNLMMLEFKKIWKAPALRIAVVLLLAVNFYSLVFGSQPGSHKAEQSPLSTDIEQRKEDGAHFAGVITKEWYQKHKAEQNALILNPANQVPDNEKEAVRQEYRSKGYSEEAISQMGEWIYLKEEIRQSNEYLRFEDIEFSAAFYDNAKATGDLLAKQYRADFPGTKGAVLAEKVEQMYTAIADEYTAYYNYDLGYWKLRNMHKTFPLTIGLIVLIGLAPIFSSEYSLKTDALVLSTKHGKGKLIHAKIKAGLLFSLLAWSVIEGINTLLIYGFYGYTGAEAYWQNWITDYAPFPLNQLQITLVTVATSLLGVLFLASVLMAVSSCSKNQFAALATGGAVLLLPYLDNLFQDNRTLQKIFSFTPTRVLTAINEWQGFSLCYLFGEAVPIQYVVLVSAVLITALGIILSFFFFKKHQVEN